MSEQNFDVVIVGGGPGGYVCAIKAAQLGLKVACIESRKTLGGTCLNEGCIPSKALLDSSGKYFETQHDFKDHGINVKEVSLDVPTMMQRKEKIVSDLTKGIAFLFNKNKVAFLNGYGTFIDANTLDFKGEDTTYHIKSKYFVIATGSVPITLPNIPSDPRIGTSKEALEYQEAPKNLVVIGGGYIGLELGSVWQRAGSNVYVVEAAERILPQMDTDISSTLHKILEKPGLKILTNHKVKEVVAGDQISVKLDGETQEINCDKVLMALGRKPYTTNLGLDKVGIEVDARGFIPIDEHCKTNADNIFAIGDVVGGLMLAHKAEKEGIMVAEIMAGQKGHIDYDIIPAVVYTNPEIATVGKSEAELNKLGIKYKVGKFPFTANSRAKTISATEGFVKIIADERSDRVLGVQIVGSHIDSLIAEAAAIMAYGGCSEDIARICHAHPTMSEAVKEAAMAVTGKPIHI